MLRLNPGWEGKIWTRDNFPKLFNEREFNDIKGLSFKSDVIRYELIARYGGVYCDFDVIWLRPLEEFIDLSHDFVARENMHVLNNGIFGAKRGSPFAWDLVGNMTESYLTQRDVGGRTHQTGVHFFSKVADRHAPNLVRLPPKTFHPYEVKDFRGADLVDHPVACGIHFFNSNGFDGKIDRLIREGKV